MRYSHAIAQSLFSCHSDTPLRADTRDATRPFQTVQRLPSQPPSASFGGLGGIGARLALAPGAQDPRMQTVDPAPPVERIQGFHDVIGITRARTHPCRAIAYDL